MAKKKKAAKKKTAKKSTASRKKAVKKKTAAKKKTAKKKTVKKKAAGKKKPAKKKTAKKKTAKKKAAGKKKPAKKKTVKKKAAKKKTAKKKAATKKKTKKKAVKKKATPKKKAKKKTVKKKAAPKKKAATKKKTATKKKAAAKKKTVKKAVKKKTATKKKTVKKAKSAVKKKVSKKKTAAKKKAMPKAAPSQKEGIPTLELEQFEPESLIETGAVDRFFGSTKYAWLGSGQAGGRLAKAFYDLGYGKVLAVNTTRHDLNMLEIPESHKYLMDIGEKGAGKEMARGKEAVSQSKQDILHTCRQLFGTEIDHAMVAFGAGGGTGGGSAKDIVDVVRNYARSIGKEDPGKAVGALMTIPTLGESASPQIAENAYKVANELGDMSEQGLLSPLVIIDNEKISSMYPGMTVKEYWKNINDTVAGLFDVFNKLSALSSPYTAFDPVDYQSIIGAGGCCIMGLTKVNEFKDRFALSEAVRRNLQKTLLSEGFDLSTAKVAGCVMVGGKQMMASVPGLQDNINFAFDVLADITGNATIHRGIYEDNKESLRVYTIIGGLDFPRDRIEQIITPK